MMMRTIHWGDSESVMKDGAARSPSPREAVGRVGDVSAANEPGWGVRES